MSLLETLWAVGEECCYLIVWFVYLWDSVEFWDSVDAFR